MKYLNLGKKRVGIDFPTFFIADIGANHDGSLTKAKELIHMCAEAGADAAKFQNFKAEKIVSRYGFDNLKSKLSHQKSWKKSVFEIYKDATINPDWTPILKETCDKFGIEYFTSPYDFESVDIVDPYVNVYKIGSGDITWTEIIKYIAQKNKPVLLATGASDIKEVERAMSILKKYTKEIVLMQCNTNYTGSVENFKYINLNVLSLYKKLFPDIILGLSDHSPSFSPVLGAVTLGARVIEKHFTDNKKNIGPDHSFAIDPISWKEMVERTRELEFSLGDGIKKIEENERGTVVVQRRSLRATRNIAVGEKINYDMFEALRPIPIDGIPPFMMDEIVGSLMRKPIEKGQHITLKHLDSSISNKIKKSF